MDMISHLIEQSHKWAVLELANVRTPHTLFKAIQRVRSQEWNGKDYGQATAI